MPRRPNFPSHKDLCNLSFDDAHEALAALRALVAADLATVYTSAGSNDTRWQVWLEHTRRRVELPTWAAAWCAANLVQQQGTDVLTQPVTQANSGTEGQ